ncbi:MAG: T9SS type A sorting domain-containing protein [Saprospiraceae bacterium]|nr:T9SS type A sorting domain-containing protein [Saprospiraceae bacterium]
MTIITRFRFLFCFIWCIAPSEFLPGQVLPDMPQEWIETCVPETDKSITVCSSGCNFLNSQLQQAIQAATPGTTIWLEQGVSYTGPFDLPEKSGDGWIIIRTAVEDNLLPSLNERIKPEHAPFLAKILAKPGLSAIKTKTRAHHFYFLGIEIAATDFSWNLVEIGSGEKNTGDLPHDITFDRLYIHGHKTLGSRRGIAMNGRRIAVVNSWLSDFKEVGFDSQAICAWNGKIFKLVNNYLEGSGENVMFGGAKPSIQDLLCSDIEVRQNHFFKPLSWRVGDPSYEGTHWTVKNLFELKNADRVWIQGNIFENNWSDAQTGFAILFTPRTESGSCPWITVQNVTFEENIVRHTGSCFNISGRDNNYSITPANRILLRHNLAEDINGNIWGGDGRTLQVLGGVHHLTVDHNTFINPKGGTFINADGANFPNENFIYRNNITSNGVYGLHGSGKGIGNPALNFYFPEAQFHHNVLTDGKTSNGGSPANYPADNYFPGPMADIGFKDFNSGLGGDYSLLPGSLFSDAGSDGLDIGADMEVLLLTTEGVLSGLNEVCDFQATHTNHEMTKTNMSDLLPWPNPGNNTLFIPVQQKQYTSVVVQDLKGQIAECVEVSWQEDGLEMDTSALRNGLYIIQVQTAGTVYRCKWIKAD